MSFRAERVKNNTTPGFINQVVYELTLILSCSNQPKIIFYQNYQAGLNSIPISKWNYKLMSIFNELDGPQRRLNPSKNSARQTFPTSIWANTIRNIYKKLMCNNIASN